MIGVISGNKIFEFRDSNDLAKSLDVFGSKYGCNSVIIVDTSDKVKAVVIDELFYVTPDLNEEQKYYIYGTTLRADDLSRNDKLPVRSDWQLGPVPFAYINQRIPKEISVY